jgi:methylglyoxal synthase
MFNEALALSPRKRIALVAHDNKKRDLLEWALYNRDLLVRHELCATGTTGSMLEKTLQTKILKLQSGPLGGDQQIGAKIAEGVIDFVIFFWDPLEPQPHDPDVKALLRIAVVWNVPVACNRASADFMISSPLMASAYQRILPDFELHRNRFGTELEVSDEAEEVDDSDDPAATDPVKTRGDEVPEPEPA